ncbi:MAG: hypothetical protein Q4D98_04955 [Planctomycetia bacterium]|nr:hypothetical protein [Planctomycetia bacterium]
MDKTFNRILVLLLIALLLFALSVFLRTGYKEQKHKSEITRVTVELLSIRKQLNAGQKELAEQDMRLLRDYVGTLDSPQVLAAVLPLMADTLDQMGKKEEARDALNTSIKLAEVAVLVPLERARLYCFLANTACVLQNHELCRQMILKAQDALPGLADDAEKADLCFYIAQSWSMLDDLDKVRQYRQMLTEFTEKVSDPKRREQLQHQDATLTELVREMETPVVPDSSENENRETSPK